MFTTGWVGCCEHNTTSRFETIAALRSSIQLDDLTADQLVERLFDHPHRPIDDLAAGGDDGAGLLPP